MSEAMRMHRKALLIFFLIFSLLVPGAHAADEHTKASLSDYNLEGTKDMRIFLFSIKNLHYKLTLQSGSIVTDGKEWNTIYTHASGKVWGFPQKLGDLSFAELTITVDLHGPRTSLVTVLDCDPADGGTGPVWKSDGGHVSFNQSGPSIIPRTYPQGVYWLSATITLSYGDTKRITSSCTVFSEFQHIMLVKYTDSSDPLKVIGNAFSSTFGLVGSLWSTAASQIGALDWGTLLKLDVLGFLGEIVSMLSILGYALFETFVMPPTAISLIMQMQTSAMVMSFFVLAYVALLIAIVGGMIVLYKVIMLLKP